MVVSHTIPMRICLLSSAVLLSAACGQPDNDTKPSPKTTVRAQKPAVTRSASAGSFSSADYKARLAQLKQLAKDKAPDTEFHYVVQKPFVVIGDEPASFVEQRAVRTVKWAVDRLKQAYFARDPKHVLSVWLFRDKTSYRKHTKAIFGDNPDTPYGYYSSTHRALIMNIATGGGTLVHEIVHPFIESNFPACPAWFNEGLGSLYEQSSSRAGRIIGLTNWRLAGLQKAIRAGTVPSFKQLMSTTTHAFYNADPGTNYAQARYLLYYLQEHKLLRRYYRAFVANVKADPTGFATLQKVLGRKDLDAFKREWEQYVLRLRFRG